MLLLSTLSGIVLICAYCTIGLFTTKFGLHKEWEPFVLAGLYGFLIGPLQSVSRVIYGEMIPRGQESEFFSLYTIIDKGGSWIGPIVQLLLGWLTGNQRYGFPALGVMVLVSFPILIILLNIHKGRQEAFLFSQQLQIQERETAD